LFLLAKVKYWVQIYLTNSPNNASSTTQNGYPHLVGYLPHHQLPLLGAWPNYQSFADVSQNLGVDFDFGALDGLCVFARLESGFCEMAQ
jgi:hypothetical protein